MSKPIADENEILRRCQERLGYAFGDPSLLRSALTHTSGANTRLGSNERLEFLGDSVLGLVCCEYIYGRFPKYEEGELTRVKSVVVSRNVCAKLSLKLKLGEFLFLGRGMQKHTKEVSNLLADVFEAVVGAIYLDGGFGPAQKFLLPLIKNEVEAAVDGLAAANAKSLLQQVGQRTYGGMPRYLVLAERGPDHRKEYKIAATIKSHFFPSARGANKKEAELRAAMNALANIQGLPLPWPCDA